MIRKVIKTIMAITLALSMFVVPVCASDAEGYIVQPRYDHTESATLSIGFDKNNVIYCSLTVETYSTGRGTSGIMTLYDSNGAILQQWPISDYEQPISADFTYQGTYGERYTLTYSGYVYGTGLVMPDQIELSITDTCVDIY